MEIRVSVTNTGQALLVTVPTVQKDAICDQIKVTFLAPNGNMTGRLFPSGARKDNLPFDCPMTGARLIVEATLIDSGNPFVLVSSESMPRSHVLDGSRGRQSQAMIEAIRRAGSVRMGLARDLTEAGLCRGTPKIAIVAPIGTWSPEADLSADVEVTAFSTGVLHPSFQVSGAVCLGAALSIPGTIASNLLPSSTPPGPEPSYGKLRPPCVWRIAHRTGHIQAEIVASQDESGNYFIERGSIIRTVRKLFEGPTFY